VAESCHFCDLVSEPDQIVYQDEHWTAGLGNNVPGWLLVWANRHVEGMWGMNDAEAASLGPMVQRLSTAVHDVCDAERVYMMAFGEHVIHYHFMIMPRTADTPPEARSAAMLAKMQDWSDPERALEVAGKLRAAL
jgi:diadenosine tetraphosphate (Ap4A) HIT family hydrolase